MHSIKTGLAALMIGLAATAAQASDPSREIAVTGQGSVAAAPDMATISIGVTEEGKEARAAMQAASASVSDMLTRLGEIGIDPADIQTERLTVNPVWSNRRGTTNQEPPSIVGFVATNSISVRVRDLAGLGAVLDGILEDGANEFSGLRFGLSDPDPLLNEARRAAVADAKARAALYAEAAGVTLGPLRSLSEQGGGPGPKMMEMAAARDVSVPIAEGQVTMQASVSMVFDIVD